MDNNSPRNESSKSCAGQAVAFLGIIVSALYLANFTFGVIEIPDNLPVVGNVDEVFFSFVLFSCLEYLGFHVTSFTNRIPLRKGNNKSDA